MRSVSTFGITAMMFSTSAVADGPDPSVSSLDAPDNVAKISRKLSFARDVVPALTKAGCNAGACHGSFQGRGGFQLSLLGFDPAFDYDVLMKASRGRRILSANPAKSLLLQKAIGAIPHGGGRRIQRQSEVYRILHEYISQGSAPVDSLEPRIARLEVVPSALTMQSGESATLQVFAHGTDNSVSDITAWALYDSRNAAICDVTRTGKVTAHDSGKSPITIRYAGYVAAVDVTIPFVPTTTSSTVDFPENNFIDGHVKREWERVGLVPAPLCSDAEFLRRVSLDLIGTLPSDAEAREFLASTDTDKRNQLIDRLLGRPEYAEYWGMKWGDLLRVHRRFIGDKGLASFTGWLKSSLRENRPLDEMVRELLTAQGNVFKDGPVAYFFIDEKPEDLAETTAQVFLGIRMQCTRCHHHPLESWGQDDYYGLAAFFTRLEIKQPQELGNTGRFGGARILKWTSMPSPRRTLKVSADPHVLGSREPIAIAENEDVRKQLADWITSPRNEYFSRNIVNRYWAYMMGPGLVEPIDDMRASNPASHPALLDELARHFAENQFDLKLLLKTICQSRVYQLSMNLNPQHDQSGAFYTFHMTRRLQAEVLLDAINQVANYQETFPGLPPGVRAISLPDPTIESRFLDTFGRPTRANACECARNGKTDLAQTLNLLNGTVLQDKIGSPGGRLTKLLNAGKTDAEILEELYLVTMSRFPTASETQAVTEILAEAGSRQEGWEDLLWSLLNCSEFVYQH